MHSQFKQLPLNISDNLGAHVVDVGFQNPHLGIRGSRIFIDPTAAQHSEHVGSFLVIPTAGAIPDSLHPKARQHPETPANGGQDGRSRRRDQLASNPVGVDGHSLEQFRCRRRGNRHGPVGAVYRPPTHVEGGGQTPGRAQPVQSHKGPDNIDDGVHGSHFVKVNLFHRGAVHLGLGFGKPEKGPAGIVLDPGIQSAAADDLLDGRIVPVMVLFAGFHVVFGCLNSCLVDAVGFEAEVSDAQLFQLAGEMLRRESQIHQRPQDHVTTDSREAVEIKRLTPLTFHLSRLQETVRRRCAPK